MSKRYDTGGGLFQLYINGRQPNFVNEEIAKNFTPPKNIQINTSGSNKFSDGRAAFAGKVSSIASGVTGILGSAMSLATPKGGSLLDNIKSQAASLNRTKVRGSMDDIYSTAMNFTPLKTNYGWKDFYADGGYLGNPYYYNPYTYGIGGEMATGILGSAVSGASAGAAFGPVGSAIGGAVGLIGGLFGANVRKKKAKRMANDANAANELANEGMQMKINNAVDDAKMTQLIGYENAKPYAFGGTLDGAIDYGLMTDYLNMRNKQATNKSTPVANMGNSFMKEMPTMTVFDTTNSFANGGGIHIAKNKKGTFTAAATKHGMGVQEFANYVLSHKNKFSAGMVKKANFARNFGGHKHSQGGILTQEDNAISNTQDKQQQAMLAFQAAYEDALKNNKETFDFNGQTYSTADVTAYLQQNNANASYALGGDIQVDGADFTDNLAHVDAGDTHESNPNGGVPMGIAPDGQPNLVEEGETIWNDYVFSNRIKPDKEILEQFHIYSKGGKITYADLSKKLEEEAKERPNDPISQAALEANMEKLANAQEVQKQKEEIKKAEKAFEAMSPEEQQALIAQMQGVATQQQPTEPNTQEVNEEQQYQEQPNDYQGEEQQYAETPQEQYAEENHQEEYSPEELQALQEQQALEQQPVEAADGGELHEFAKGGKKHTGTWKKGWSSGKAWDTYSKPAVEAFYDNLYNEVKDVKDPAKRQYIIDQRVKQFNDMQKSYWGIYKGDNLNTTLYGMDKAVGAHQTLWNNAGGNNYFSGTDKDGKPFSIADNINLPKGAKTGDKYNTWVDGFKGPRTSIRNYGSTEYGNNEHYKDLIDKFSKLGVTMAANPNLTYGKNKYQLYTLSTRPDPSVLNAKPIVGLTPPKNINIQELPQAAAAGTANDDKRPTIPYKAEWPRYVGMFGPVAGLLAAPFTKPNDKYYRESINAVNSRPVLATPTLIGDYEVHNPFALWDAQNKADATRLATNRAIMNNNGSVGQKMTGLIANDNNYYTGLGNLVRTAQEYNNNDENRVKTFNRGTNQYNADAINRFALANAEAQNQNNQFKANALMNYANQMAAREDLWKQGILGNVNQLFANIGELGKENAIGNQVAALGNNGVFGVLNNDMLNYGIAGRSAKKKSKGGKLNKRRKGLTF